MQVKHSIKRTRKPGFARAALDLQIVAVFHKEFA